MGTPKYTDERTLFMQQHRNAKVFAVTTGNGRGKNVPVNQYLETQRIKEQRDQRHLGGTVTLQQM
eukprot:671117-Rhodomonas_salina.1